MNLEHLQRVASLSHVIDIYVSTRVQDREHWGVDSPLEIDDRVAEILDEVPGFRFTVKDSNCLNF